MAGAGLGTEQEEVRAMGSIVEGAEATAMKAIVWSGYGRPRDVLSFQEVEKPVVGDSDVLVSVRAASVHVGDAFMIRGMPKAMRPIFASIRRKNRIPGTDIAGVVEAVGANVARFKPGDEVFGSGRGGFAEHVATSEDALALKPANLTFEQAAAMGVSAFTALQALRDHGRVEAGQKVLITGASGGVGTFAVQIAKSLGAEVTGVCSTRNMDMVRSLGADDIIDYTQTNWTRTDDRYDLILDNVGNSPLSAARRPLTARGILLANGAPISGWFGGLGRFAKATIVSLFLRRQGRPFVSFPNQDDLETLRDLAERGEVKSVIDRTYPLSDTALAIEHVGERHSQGKTVITM
jgi:NADPH:quinone reductase-like Zn-dependent oxidoreductase